MTKISKKAPDIPNPQNPDHTENNAAKSFSDLLASAVFIFTLIIVLISLLSVVFPALITSSNSIFQELKDLGIVPAETDSFVLGVWTGPLFAANLIVFGLTILYFKKKLPKFISKLINFVFTFEVSKKVAFITIAVLLAFYVGVSVGDLAAEEDWEDYPPVKNRVDNWKPEQISQGVEPHVRYFLLWASVNLFGYYTIIPFLASIALLLLTYFFTAKISKKRFPGIISMIILLQSNVFLTYDTTVAYTNFWILLYLLSLYLVYKVWPLSPIFYLLSIASKALTIMFLPMSIYFIFRSNLSNNKKIIIAASSVAIILAGATAIFASDINLAGSVGKQEEFNSDEFWTGFTSFAYQLRFDGLILIFILPLIVGLYIASRNGITHADSIMFLIGGILFTAPLLTGFTEQTNQPYRFVPLAVFFAVGVGVLLSKKKIINQEV